MRLSLVIAAGLVVVTSAASGQTPTPTRGRAAISGRVVDEFGDAAIHARVSVEIRTGPNATRTVAAAEADDRGDYRVSGLAAGTYLVGVFRIETVLVTPQTSFDTAASPRTPRKTYYLGAQDANEAEALRIEADEERDRIDFVLPAVLPTLPPVVIARAQQAAAAGAVPRLDTGSAILRGQVITTDGRSLPHAYLRLIPGGNIFQTRVGVAGADGQFEFRDLASGRVRVIASKPGYDPIAAERDVEMVADQTTDRVELSLARWAAITGLVVDERKAPMAAAIVRTLQLKYDGGRRRLVPVGAPRLTNDLGHYRAYGLAPGQYVITATVSGAGSADVPGYAPSYYPGTANPAAAQFVSVGISQELDGFDIPLARARTARVTGKVLNAAGLPTNPGSLSLVSSVRSALPVSISFGARLAGDGSFEFPNAPPGEYVIRADRGRSQPWVEGEFGTLPIVVDGVDVTNLTVLTSAGSTITGRFVFNVRESSKAPPASALELRPMPVDFDAAPSNVATANIHDDWTFEMTGVNGPRRLELTRVPSGWALQDVRVRGVDVTDRPLPFGTREQSLNAVEVTLTDRITELTGAVVDADGHGAQEAAVIVFATDRSRWVRGIAVHAGDGGWSGRDILSQWPAVRQL
jgi:hypothetical protein